MTPDKRTYYLGEGEGDPHGATFHKSDQTKVMFLAAVARPRRDTSANRNFSGLIGCWPIMEEYIAQRLSKYCPKGATFVCPVKIKGFIYEDLLLNKVLPALVEKWPKGTKIIIQDDNAKPHTKAAAAAMESAAADVGLDPGSGGLANLLLP